MIGYSGISTTFMKFVFRTTKQGFSVTHTHQGSVTTRSEGVPQPRGMGLQCAERYGRSTPFMWRRQSSLKWITAEYLVYCVCRSTQPLNT